MEGCGANPSLQPVIICPCPLTGESDSRLGKPLIDRPRLSSTLASTPENAVAVWFELVSQRYDLAGSEPHAVTYKE